MPQCRFRVSLVVSAIFRYRFGEESAPPYFTAGFVWVCILTMPSLSLNRYRNVIAKSLIKAIRD